MAEPGAALWARWGWGCGTGGHGAGFGGLILPLSRLLQVKLEREEFEEELRELQERFAAAREDAEQARSSAADPGELEALRKVGDEGRRRQAAPGTPSSAEGPRHPTPLRPRSCGRLSGSWQRRSGAGRSSCGSGSGSWRR